MENVFLTGLYRPIFLLFKHNFYWQTVGFTRIQTQIVRVEGEHADHWSPPRPKRWKMFVAHLKEWLLRHHRTRVCKSADLHSKCCIEWCLESMIPGYTMFIFLKINGGSNRASFFFIFIFSTLSSKNLADDWMQTVDLWFWMQPFFQLSHNHWLHPDCT